MPISLILALSIPVLGAGLRTEVAAGAAIQAGGGISPVQMDSASQPRADATLTLLSGFRMASLRSSIMLTYRPSFYFQIPETIDFGRPLLLHSLRGSFETRPSRRTTFIVGTNVRFGEVSYGDLSQIFDVGTGTVDSRIIPLAYVTSDMALGYQMTRRHSLGLQLDGGFSTPLDRSYSSESNPDEEVQTGGLFSTTYSASLSLSDAYTPNNRDSISLSIRGGLLVSESAVATDLDTSNSLVAWGSTIGWSRNTSPSSSVGVIAGGAFTYSANERDFDFVPNLVGRYSTSWRVGRQEWNSTFSGGLRGFLDRIAAIYQTRASVGWSLNGAIGRRWRTGVDATASTAFTAEPVAPPQYESTISLSLPTSFRVGNSSSLSFGLRALMRAPHILEVGNLQAQLELNVYLGYSYAFGTGESRGSWVQ